MLDELLFVLLKKYFLSLYIKDIISFNLNIISNKVNKTLAYKKAVHDSALFYKIKFI